MRFIFTKTLMAVASLLITTTVFAQRPDITVMAYNIMQLPVQDWDQQQRLAHLSDALHAMPAMPDVIVFSEVFTDDAYETLQLMNQTYPYLTPVVGLSCQGGGWQSTAGNCSNSPFVIRGGVVIASRWPIVTQHQLVFRASLSGSWDYQSNKGAAYVEIDSGAGRFHIAGTHLQATHDDKADSEHDIRMQQLTEIRQWLDEFQIPANEPVILAGDMNVDFAHKTQVAQMLSTSQTVLNFDASSGAASYPEDNWMSRAYNYYFNTDICYNDTLDYVLERRDHLRAKNTPAMTVVPLKSPEAWHWSYLQGWWPLCGGWQWHDGYTTDLSDHYPVMTTFQYSR